MGHRQHRDAGACVLVLACDGERPEMRWCPDEDDEEQQQRVRFDGVGDRRPAEHRGCSARSAADHDVLRGRALEEHGVDDGIADQRGEGQHRSERVDEPPQHQHRRHAEHAGEHQRLVRLETAGRQRSATGTRHLFVDLAVEHVVDGGCTTCSQRDAEIAPHQCCERRPSRARKQRTDDRREDDERDDFGFGQFEVEPPACRSAAADRFGRGCSGLRQRVVIVGHRSCLAQSAVEHQHREQQQRGPRVVCGGEPQRERLEDHGEGDP